jgi:hypothetical protein
VSERFDKIKINRIISEKSEGLSMKCLPIHYTEEMVLILEEKQPCVLLPGRLVMSPSELRRTRLSF